MSMRAVSKAVLDWAGHFLNSAGDGWSRWRAKRGYDRYARQASRMFPVRGGGGRTEAEIARVGDVWCRYGIKSVPTDYYVIAKRYFGFDPHFLPESIFFPHVLRKMQDLKLSMCLTNKALYGFYYGQDNRPYEPIRCLNGSFYNADNNCLTRGEALVCLQNYGRPFLIKPALWSGCGCGIEKIESPEQVTDLLFDRYGSDFVCQEIVRQCDALKALNPTSVNCIRITSLFLNGSFSVLSATVKIGARGMIVDNVGHGGYLVGVESDGRLKSVGFDLKGRTLTMTDAGRRLNMTVVPSFGRVLDLVRSFHVRMPDLPIIGFDMAINERGDPLMIEMNADYPGVFFEQLCTGPILGERFAEVMDFVSSRKR